MQPVDIQAVRAAFDAQIRQKAEADEPGALVEAEAGLLRWVAPGTQTSCIIWSQLTADSADAAIAAQKRYFAARGTPVEWKYYDYDQPADLPQRLRAAGFEPEDEELMLVAETAAISHDVVLPDGIRLEPVTDDGWRRRDEWPCTNLPSASRRLSFSSGCVTSYARRRTSSRWWWPWPETSQSARPGSSSSPGTDFAGLWGGGTVPAWRGRGIFRALVAYRAGLAAERGYRYLQVDALPTSRPILQRLGFEPVASTTPYVFTPARSGPDE